MNHNRKHTKLGLRIALSCAIVVVAAVATIGVMMYTQESKVTPPPNLVKDAASVLQFAFDATLAPGWRQGPANKVSMALFSNDQSSGCWASIEFKPLIIDQAVELQKIQDSWVESGYAVTQNAPTPITMQTKNGELSYELQSYTVVNTASSEPILGGQGFAYVPVKNGTIKVQAYCNSADELPTITPALQATLYTPAA